jgi:outer membrane protein
MVRRTLLAGLLLALLGAGAWAQPTPPVRPQIEPVELPAPVELPLPAELPPAAPTAPLTAAEAAAIALHNQPAVTIAAAGVKAAAGRTQAVQAGLKPQVAVTAALSGSRIQGNENGAGAPANFQATAKLSQLLYDYEHTRDLVRQAQAQESAARAALTTVQADLVLRVKRAFYDHLQDVRLVTVAESEVQSQQHHLALAQARLDSGLGLPYDGVRAQTAYSAAIYGLTVARNAAVQSRVALAQLLGLDPRTPLTPAEGTEAAGGPLDVPALTDEAVANRPEMAQAQAAILSARCAVAAAHTVNAPVVTGSLGLTRKGDEFFPQTGLVTLGVGVQWSAVDGGLTRGRVQEAEANLEIATAQRETVRLQVIADVSEAYLDLRTAELRSLTAQAEVTNAAEALRLAEGHYRSGLGVFIDVLDAQAALTEANTKLVNTRAEVEQARAALERAVGRNLPAPPA